MPFQFPKSLFHLEREPRNDFPRKCIFTFRFPNYIAACEPVNSGEFFHQLKSDELFVDNNRTGGWLKKGFGKVAPPQVELMCSEPALWRLPVTVGKLTVNSWHFSAGTTTSQQRHAGVNSESKVNKAKSLIVTVPLTGTKLIKCSFNFLLQNNF